jgi:hypothetical protein
VVSYLQDKLDLWVELLLFGGAFNLCFLHQALEFILSFLDFGISFFLHVFDVFFLLFSDSRLEAAE